MLFITSYNVLSMESSKPLANSSKVQRPNEQLCAAIRSFNEEKAENFLKLGANPNCEINKLWERSNLKAPILFFAIDRGDPVLVQLLIKYGADVNATMELGYFSCPYSLNEEIILLSPESNIQVSAFNFAAIILLELNFKKERFEDKINNQLAICKILLDAGASILGQVICKKFFDYKRIPISTFLLHFPLLMKDLLTKGADIYNDNLKDKFRLEINQFNPNDLTSIILLPSLRSMRNNWNEYKPKMWTIILCMKRKCPKMPTDLRNYLLNFICDRPIGDFAILKKLKLEKLNLTLTHAAARSIYEHTILHLQNEIPLEDNWIEQHKEEMMKNIYHRLAQPKLLINNPSKVFFGPEYEEYMNTRNTMNTLNTMDTKKGKNCSIQ